MFYKTAESVSPKHPDKLCDQISDAILDAYLAEDPNARVAAEACGGHGVVFVTGEITSTADVDIPAIVKRIAGDNVEVHSQTITRDSSRCRYRRGWRSGYNDRVCLRRNPRNAAAGSGTSAQA